MSKLSPLGSGHALHIANLHAVIEKSMLNSQFYRFLVCWVAGESQLRFFGFEFDYDNTLAVLRSKALM